MTAISDYYLNNSNMILNKNRNYNNNKYNNIFLKKIDSNKLTKYSYKKKMYADRKDNFKTNSAKQDEDDKIKNILHDKCRRIEQLNVKKMNFFSLYIKTKFKKSSNNALTNMKYLIDRKEAKEICSLGINAMLLMNIKKNILFSFFRKQTVWNTPELFFYGQCYLIGFKKCNGLWIFILLAENVITDRMRLIFRDKFYGNSTGDYNRISTFRFSLIYFVTHIFIHECSLSFSMGSYLDMMNIMLTKSGYIDVLRVFNLRIQGSLDNSKFVNSFEITNHSIKSEFSEKYIFFGILGIHQIYRSLKISKNYKKKYSLLLNNKKEYLIYIQKIVRNFEKERTELFRKKRIISCSQKNLSMGSQLGINLLNIYCIDLLLFSNLELVANRAIFILRLRRLIAFYFNSVLLCRYLNSQILLYVSNKLLNYKSVVLKNKRIELGRNIKFNVHKETKILFFVLYNIDVYKKNLYDVLNSQEIIQKKHLIHLYIENTYTKNSILFSKPQEIQILFRLCVLSYFYDFIRSLNLIIKHQESNLINFEVECRKNSECTIVFDRGLNLRMKEFDLEAFQIEYKDYHNRMVLLCLKLNLLNSYSGFGNQKNQIIILVYLTGFMKIINHILFYCKAHLNKLLCGNQEKMNSINRNLMLYNYSLICIALFKLSNILLLYKIRNKVEMKNNRLYCMLRKKLQKTINSKIIILGFKGVCDENSILKSNNPLNIKKIFVKNLHKVVFFEKYNNQSYCFILEDKNFLFHTKNILMNKKHGKILIGSQIFSVFIIKFCIKENNNCLKDHLLFNIKLINYKDRKFEEVNSSRKLKFPYNHIEFLLISIIAIYFNNYVLNFIKKKSIAKNPIKYGFKSRYYSPKFTSVVLRRKRLFESKNNSIAFRSQNCSRTNFISISLSNLNYFKEYKINILHLKLLYFGQIFHLNFFDNFYYPLTFCFKKILCFFGQKRHDILIGTSELNYEHKKVIYFLKNEYNLMYVKINSKVTTNITKCCYKYANMHDFDSNYMFCVKLEEQLHLIRIFLSENITNQIFKYNHYKYDLIIKRRNESVLESFYLRLLSYVLNKFLQKIILEYERRNKKNAKLICKFYTVKYYSFKPEFNQFSLCNFSKKAFLFKKKCYANLFYNFIKCLHSLIKNKRNADFYRKYFDVFLTNHKITITGKSQHFYFYEQIKSKRTKIHFKSIKISVYIVIQQQTRKKTAKRNENLFQILRNHKNYEEKKSFIFVKYYQKTILLSLFLKHLPIFKKTISIQNCKRDCFSTLFEEFINFVGNHRFESLQSNSELKKCNHYYNFKQKNRLFLILKRYLHCEKHDHIQNIQRNSFFKSYIKIFSNRKYNFLEVLEKKCYFRHFCQYFIGFNSLAYHISNRKIVDQFKYLKKINKFPMLKKKNGTYGAFNEQIDNKLEKNKSGSVIKLNCVYTRDKSVNTQKDYEELSKNRIGKIILTGIEENKEPTTRNDTHNQRKSCSNKNIQHMANKNVYTEIKNNENPTPKRKNANIAINNLNCKKLHSFKRCMSFQDNNNNHSHFTYVNNQFPYKRSCSYDMSSIKYCKKEYDKSPKNEFLAYQRIIGHNNYIFKKQHKNNHKNRYDSLTKHETEKINCCSNQIARLNDFVFGINDYKMYRHDNYFLSKLKMQKEQYSYVKTNPYEQSRFFNLKNTYMDAYKTNVGENTPFSIPWSSVKSRYKPNTTKGTTNLYVKRINENNEVTVQNLNENKCNNNEIRILKCRKFSTIRKNKNKRGTYESIKTMTNDKNAKFSCKNDINLDKLNYDDFKNESGKILLEKTTRNGSVGSEFSNKIHVSNDLIFDKIGFRRQIQEGYSNFPDNLKKENIYIEDKRNPHFEAKKRIKQFNENKKNSCDYNSDKDNPPKNPINKKESVLANKNFDCNVVKGQNNIKQVPNSHKIIKKPFNEVYTLKHENVSLLKHDAYLNKTPNNKLFEQEMEKCYDKVIVDKLVTVLQAILCLDSKNYEMDNMKAILQDDELVNFIDEVFGDSFDDIDDFEFQKEEKNITFETMSFIDACKTMQKEWGLNNEKDWPILKEELKNRLLEKKMLEETGFMICTESQFMAILNKILQDKDLHFIEEDDQNISAYVHPSDEIERMNQKNKNSSEDDYNSFGDYIDFFDRDSVGRSAIGGSIKSTLVKDKESNKTPNVIECGYFKCDGRVRPYVCSVSGCSKSYTSPHGLKYHRIHGHRKNMFEIKPYLCDIPGCKRRYKNANGLKYHLEKGHGTYKV